MQGLKGLLAYENDSGFDSWIMTSISTVHSVVLTKI